MSRPAARQPLQATLRSSQDGHQLSTAAAPGSTAATHRLLVHRDLRGPLLLERHQPPLVVACRAGQGATGQPAGDAAGRRSAAGLGEPGAAQQCRLQAAQLASSQHEPGTPNSTTETPAPTRVVVWVVGIERRGRALALVHLAAPRVLAARAALLGAPAACGATGRQGDRGRREGELSAGGQPGRASHEACMKPCTSLARHHHRARACSSSRPRHSPTPRRSPLPLRLRWWSWARSRLVFTPSL